MQKNTSTTIINKDAISKKVYMVLKKKAINENEIVKAITEETCIRLESWLESKKASIQQKIKDFDNPAKGLECLILKKLIAILNEMEKEFKGRMSEKDLRSYRILIESSQEEFEIHTNASPYPNSKPFSNTSSNYSYYK